MIGASANGKTGGDPTHRSPQRLGVPSGMVVKQNYAHVIRGAVYLHAVYTDSWACSALQRQNRATHSRTVARSGRGRGTRLPCRSRWRCALLHRRWKADAPSVAHNSSRCALDCS